MADDHNVHRFRRPARRHTHGIKAILDSHTGCSKRLSSEAAGREDHEAYRSRYVEDFDDPKPQPGKGRVSARPGLGGCNIACFSILAYM